MSENNFSKKYIFMDPAKQRRKHARVRLETPCDVYYPKLKRPITGLLVDISVGGIRFEANALFYEGDTLEVEFFWNNRLFHISGVVIRVSGKYVAIKTDNTSEEDIEEIQNFIFDHYNKNDSLRSTLISVND